MRKTVGIFPSLMLLSLLAIFMVATPVQAYTTYSLVATPVENQNYLGAFRLEYVDYDGDKLFEVAELVPGTFSGMLNTQFNWPNPDTYVFYDILTGAAGRQDDSPYTDEVAHNPDPLNTYRSWSFASSAPEAWGLTAGGFNWTYERTVVPLPPSVLMLGAGLIPLVWGSRRRRWFNK